MRKTLGIALITTIIQLLILLPSAHSQLYHGDSLEIQSILENINQFSQSVINADSKKIADAYTDDAKLFPINTDILVGKDTIQAYWTPSGKNRTVYHKIHPLEITIIGEEAYDYGYYEGTTRLEDGTESSWKGKYVIIWKRIEGEWKIYIDIWNRIRS